MSKIGILATAAAIVLVGCGGEAPAPPRGTAAATSSPLPPAQATEQLCQHAFGSSNLLAWTVGTVAGFRAFQYSGPTPIRPLTDVYPGLPASTSGAWCATRQAPDTTRWWVVVAGHPGVKAIDITGPGEGQRQGYVPTGPVVP